MSNEKIFETKSRKLVYGHGPFSPQVAVVGEAPGAEEEKAGRPFVGRSGKLLSRVLLQGGVARHECYMTNTVKVRPRKNDIKEFADLSKKEPKLSDTYRTHVELLRQELAEVDTNLIIACGNIPLYALTGKKGIMKWRGSVLPSTLLPGRKILPIIHPAAALRQPLYEYYMRMDMQKVEKQKHFADIRRPDRAIHLNPTAQQAIDYINECNELAVVGFDIEIINHELSCFALAKKPDDVMCIPFRRGVDDNYNPRTELRIMQALGRLLMNPNVKIVMQNAIFDSTFMFQRYGMVTNNMEDTMIAHAILYPDLPKGLDFLTSMYTEEPYYKDDGKMFFGAANHNEEFWKYNARDSAVTLEVWYVLERDLARQRNMQTYRRQLALLTPLTYAATRGTLMDVEGLRNASEKAGVKLEEIYKEFTILTKQCGKDLNPRSTRDLKFYFYDYKGIKVINNRKTGNPTTDDKALKKLAAMGLQEASLLLTARKLEKLKGTYYDVALDKDGRMRCSYNPVGTEQGRISSSKTIYETGANMQNQPWQMKKYQLADPGYLMYNMDLSQAENRVVAYTSDEVEMIRAFEEGIDIHSQTGARIASIFYGTEISTDDVKDMHNTLQKLLKQNDGILTADELKKYGSPIGGGDKSWRDWGKRSNHGLNYDFSAYGFSALYEIALQQSKQIVNSYHMIYPGVKRNHRAIQQRLRENMTLINCVGRIRMFLHQWDSSLFKVAYSFNPQSTVADIMNKHGVSYMWEEPAFDRVEFLNTVHDSIVWQVPIDAGIDYHIMVLEKMKASLEVPITWDNHTFSIPIDAEVGPNLGDMTELDFNESLSDQLHQAARKAAM